MNFLAQVNQSLKEKSKGGLYHVEALCENPETHELEVSGVAYQFKGKINDVAIVSVPPDTSLETVDSLIEVLTEQLGTAVLVISHNIEFLKVQRIGDLDDLPEEPTQEEMS